MRLLVYNIAYGTGAPKAFYQQLWTVHRYFRTPQSHLDRIIRFIDKSEADLVGLVEVDSGSPRTNYVNQVDVVANHLKRYQHSSNKYGQEHFLGKLPYLRQQVNAVLTRDDIDEATYHYFPMGFKKLIIEVEVKGIQFFLVHLALRRRTRRKQLVHLTELIGKREKPLIIAGDFNVFKGAHEIEYLQKQLDVRNVNLWNLPTYPAWNPKRQLDFILCSPEIQVVDFQVPHVKYSDHLPLIMDFEI